MRFLDHFIEIRDRVVITGVQPGIYMVGQSKYNLQDFDAAIAAGTGFNYLTDMRINTPIIVLDLQPSLKMPDANSLASQPRYQMNYIFRSAEKCIAASPNKTEGMKTLQVPY